MFLNDRKEAGILLAKKLTHYKNKEVVVYAIPRGGVIVAFEIAQYLNAPLDLIITHKIGHPANSEYAVAATSEEGHTISDPQALGSLGVLWLKKSTKVQQLEIKRRRETYMQGRTKTSAQNRSAILVDDGVATGLTLRVAIEELKHQKPKEIIVAVPVISQEIANEIKSLVAEIIALDMPPEDQFLGAVGSYYERFPPVEDEEVIKILSL